MERSDAVGASAWPWASMPSMPGSSAPATSEEALMSLILHADDSFGEQRRERGLQAGAEPVLGSS